MTEQINSNAAFLLDDKRVIEIVEALRTIEDLEGLTEDEFVWLASHGTEKFRPDGDLIFSPEMPPDHLIFILSGAVRVHRNTSSPVSVIVGLTERVTGKTPFSRIQAWNADGRSSGETWTLEVHEIHFPGMLLTIPSMTQRLVRTLLERNRSIRAQKSRLENWPR